MCERTLGCHSAVAQQMNSSILMSGVPDVAICNSFLFDLVESSIPNRQSKAVIGATESGHGLLFYLVQKGVMTFAGSEQE